MNRIQKLTKKIMDFITDVKTELTVQLLEDGRSIEIDETTLEVFMLNEDGTRGEVAPDGEYILADGTKITVIEGKLDEVVAEPIPSQDMVNEAETLSEDLSEVNATLSSQLSELTNKNVKLESEFKLANEKIVELTKQLEDLKIKSVEKIALSEKTELKIEKPLSQKEAAQQYLRNKLNKN